MSPLSPKTATRKPETAADPTGAITAPVEAAFETLMRTPAAITVAGVEDRARKVCLALASALLARFGVASEHRRSALTGVAHALIGELEALDPTEAAATLSRLFERAAGASGRRDRGAVYTPDDVVDFMVTEAIAARIGDALKLDGDAVRAVLSDEQELRLLLTGRQLNELGKTLMRARILDPAVGTGAFLLGAARQLSALAVCLRDAGVRGLGPIATPARALKRCCRGYELDGESVAIANAVLALATRSARLQQLVIQRNPLLQDMRHPSARGGWDVVLMNPPYIGAKHVRRRLGDELSQALRDADGFSGDLLAHFLVRALAGVREGGVMSAIVSDTAFTMESMAEPRRKLVDGSQLLSIAWCRPFPTVAVQGGVVTALRRAPAESASVEWLDSRAKASLTKAPRRTVPRLLFRQLPGRQLYRPGPAAATIVERWASIDGLDELWHALARRNQAESLVRRLPAEGGWTLLGCAVRGGQGLATGEDRRFVGAIAGTPAGGRASECQRRILDTLRTDPGRRQAWRLLRAELGKGRQLGEALAGVGDGTLLESLPGRKPFRVIEPASVRRSPLSATEMEQGIFEGPSWVSYETSDRSSPDGGARWTRETQMVLDWSAEAVALLRRRLATGHRRPVMRNEDLWFGGGVTHNRVTSYLRARMMPKHAIFSSESPVYVPLVEWLSPHALLALLNAPVVEFALKTFLATRNHIEVGHVRRLPVPVLSTSQTKQLTGLGKRAVKAAQTDRARLVRIEAEIDRFTRDLYGVGTTRLDVTR